MKKNLKIRVVQDNPVVGAIENNVSMVKAHLERADKNGIDLLVFTECFVTGYPIGDLALRPGFVRAASQAIEDIRSRVIGGKTAVLVGGLLPGNVKPYNAAFLIEPNGNVRSVCKTELPNDDVFKEIRTFEASQQAPRPLMFRGVSLGVLICEDMWHPKVANALAGEGAELLIAINGSPYHKGKQALRRQHAENRVRATGLPLIYANQYGGQDELIFDGGSFVLGKDGMLLAQQPFNVSVTDVVFDGNDFEIENVDVNYQNISDSPYTAERILGCNHRITYPSDMEADYAAMVLGVKDYFRKCNMKRAVIGISGGLDSALVAAIAVDALGKKNVIGVMMPTRFTSKESLKLADEQMNILGIHKREISIEAMFLEAEKALGGVVGSLADDLGVTANVSIMSENLQSRIRGMQLMALSNALGALVLSTGNKSEMSVGYATLYGDMCGGYNPLKGLYKTEAFEVCRWRNSDEAAKIYGKGNVIVEAIIDRPPTAELKEGQSDENALGPYKVLDYVLKNLIEKDRISPTFIAGELVELGYDKLLNKPVDEYVSFIAGLVRGAQFKRAQACPGVKLNARDYGMGVDYPQAGGRYLHY